MKPTARRRFLRIAGVIGVVCVVVCGGCRTFAPSGEAPGPAPVEEPGPVPCKAPGPVPGDGPGRYLVGTGIYDITGPAAECGMMGYSEFGQKTAGIHMRLRARAFIVADPEGGKRVAFVSAEAGIAPQGVKQGVVRKLKQKFGELYTDENVAISASHTHSGPGAYSGYALYDFSMLGYDEKHYNTVVDGIYEAVVRAHANLEPGHIRISAGDLDEAGWNRSPEAYGNNPAEERAHYAADTDKVMTQLRFVSASGADLGAINWFAVHPTSVGNKNRLITGDNKGYASYLFEKAMGTDYAAAKTFVAAFAVSNAGDVSPNIHWGYPDGRRDYSHMETIGERQYTKALALFNDAAETLRGSVDYRHMYVKMSEKPISREFMPDRAKDGRTCVAAIGVALLAGSTEDGKGPFGLREGITYPYNLPKKLSRVFPWKFTLQPSDQKCQGEKPILLPAGRIRLQEIPLTPEVLPVQILKIGNLAIIVQPTEITTMAGRRLMNTVRSALAGRVDHVVIAALSNAYASYVTTREEYALQHYEGASTLFGPYTLNAFQEQFATLATAMRNGSPVPTGPKPPKITEARHIPDIGVIFDRHPRGKKFGTVASDAKRSYTRGQKVKVTFWGAHPRNDYRIQGTYLEVQRSTPDGWVTVASDWDPETEFSWKRHWSLGFIYTAKSKVTIAWDTTGATSGSYRIRHYGNSRSLSKKITEYTGQSRAFEVK